MELPERQAAVEAHGDHGCLSGVFERERGECGVEVDQLLGGEAYGGGLIPFVERDELKGSGVPFAGGVGKHVAHGGGDEPDELQAAATRDLNGVGGVAAEPEVDVADEIAGADQGGGFATAEERGFGAELLAHFLEELIELCTARAGAGGCGEGRTGCAQKDLLRCRYRKTVLTGVPPFSLKVCVATSRVWLEIIFRFREGFCSKASLTGQKHIRKRRAGFDGKRVTLAI